MRFIAACRAEAEWSSILRWSDPALGFMERMALDELSRRVASAGEPFQLFFNPEALAEDLKRMGFSQVERLDSGEINARYFANRSDKLRVRGGLGQLLSAFIS